ncbi:AA_permease_C domain-containing protein [Haematococcus lacustris]|uniref:AA_permease_C domain-containing protein n=1 Tax=Haematococcus lacustris TaxID=44745 RepID=A0A699YDH7_HAELA|nr:AA_permease_C domain-containing protein [Haematococcus lacustris]
MSLRDVVGFGSVAEYVGAGFFSSTDKWLTFPRTVTRRFFKTKTLAAMQEDTQETSSEPLKKTLGALDLTCLGVGFMCGAATDNYDKLLFISATLFHTCAGIFVTPGYIASALTGPALFVSYLIAAGSAFLSSFCYAEFTVSIPMAGAAYNYIYSTLGEMIAWVTVSNLILEYILANAAVARGFAPYLALLFNKPSSYFIRSWNGYRLDGWSCGLTLFLTSLLCYGIKESATANTIITIVHVVIMIFIIIAGLTKAKKANFQPFVKAGASWKNIFNGAAVSFFSFIGFDAIATTAEEMKDPARDMPIGILGAMSIVTAIYAMMCVTLSLMIPNGSIDSSAAFAAAFDTVGMQWAKYIVCIGALMGIFTGVMIGILGAARILTGCCRERMLPPILAWVSKSRQTPYVATIAIGMCRCGVLHMAAPEAHCYDLLHRHALPTALLSYSPTSTVLPAVCLQWRYCSLQRFCGAGQYDQHRHLHCLLLCGCWSALVPMQCAWQDHLQGPVPAAAAHLCHHRLLPGLYPVLGPANVAGYDYNDSYVDPIPAGPDNQQQYKWLIAMAVMTLASTISMAVFCKQDFVPAGYKVPLFPGIPAASIFVNTFLLGQLDQKSYERFGWWTLAATCLYLFYGMVCQEAHDKMLAHKLQSLPSVEPTKMLQHDQSVEVDAVKIVL